MGRTIGIFILVVVVLALTYLAYKMIFKKPADGTPCSTSGGSLIDGTFLDGVCIKAIPVNPGIGGGQGVGSGQLGFDPSINSVGVSIGDVMAAQNPSSFLTNINVLSASSYNLLTSPGSNPEHIHITGRFSYQCPKFVWYKNWIYSLRKEGTTQRTVEGDKVCFYSIDRDALPNEIKLITSGSCSVFKYYLSGTAYKYDRTETEAFVSIGSTKKTFCIYKKQK